MKRSRLVDLLVVLATTVSFHPCADAEKVGSATVTKTLPLRPFQLIIINDAAPARFVELGGRRIDPLTQKDEHGNVVSLAATQHTPADNLHVVQFARSLTAADVATLRDRKVKVVGHVPENACIVQATSADLAALRAQGNVRWVGAFAPEYRYARRLRRALAGRAAAQPEIRVHVFFIHGVSSGEAHTAVAALGSVEEIIQDSQGCILTATLAPKLLPTLAAVPGVLSIEYAPRPVLHNNESATILDVRDMWNTHGFYGSNEIVAVADSGLDIGTTNGIHWDFLDGAGKSRVIAITNLTSPSGPDSASGHGTHVAGSVLGNGHMSGANPTNNYFPPTCYAGMAPKALLYFQSIGKTNDPSGVYPPADLNNLFRPAYLAGARIHQNSWGSHSYGDYNDGNNARNADLFCFNYPQMLICVSAGNDGEDTAAPSGVVDPGSISSPGLAKNVLCVGATENNRPSFTLTWGAGWPTKFPNNPINSDRVANAITGMAAFSSRGPTSDGRIKPDIVAPGTYIASCKTHAMSGSILWGDVSGNTNYAYSGGTSMACPLVSGAAAVFREYLRVNRGWLNPPAALIKAALLCGATDINPGQYGTGATREIYPAPNGVQGWGRLNLENMLYGPATYRMYFWTNAFTSARSFVTNVVVYDTNIPFKAVLAWTDMPGSLMALDETYTWRSGGGLMNDLDLRVVDPTGKTNFPLAQNTRLDLFYYTNNSSATMYTGPSGLFEAEKCTAPQLPLTITHIYKVVYDNSGSGGDHGIFIWAEGSDGLPGATLFAQTNTLPASSSGFNYVLFNLGTPVTITSTHFFIGTQLLATNVRQARDPSSVSPRVYLNSGSGWSAASAGDMWIHAYGVCSTGDHMNTVEGVVINNPPGGTYQIIVSGNNVPYTPVWWGVAYSGGFVPEPAAALALAAALAWLRARRPCGS